MLGCFSRILIITLVLTAPLSFTGDVCPDFKPPCSVAGNHASRTAASALHGAVRAATSPAVYVTIDAAETFSPFVRFTPTCRLAQVQLHERAPPLPAPVLS